MVVTASPGSGIPVRATSFQTCIRQSCLWYLHPQLNWSNTYIHRKLRITLNRIMKPALYGCDSLKNKTDYAIVYLRFYRIAERGDPVHRDMARPLWLQSLLSRLAEHGIDTPGYIDKILLPINTGNQPNRRWPLVSSWVKSDLAGTSTGGTWRCNWRPLTHRM